MARRFQTTRKLVPEARTIVLPEGDTTIVMVSDTHSRPDPRAMSQVAALRPDLILHGGDVGDLAVLDALAALAPLEAVRGNIDEHVAEAPPDALLLSFTRSEREVLRVLLTHIAVYGPSLLKDVRALALALKVDLVACGHSHVPLLARDAGIAVFNPGSIGPRRFGLPISFGVMRLGQRLTFEHVDVDTGALWRPRP